MKKQLLSLALILALCVGLVPAAFAANPVTAAFDKYTVTFSDARVEENVPVMYSSGEHKGTVKLYYAAPNSTISIRNDSDNRLSEDSEDFYNAELGIYVGPASIQHYGWLENGSIIADSMSNGPLPLRTGDTYTQTAEEWIEGFPWVEGPAVLGIHFNSGNGDAYEDLAEIYITIDKEQTSKPAPVAPAAEGFSDVKDGDWFKVYVDKVANAGLMSGVGDGKFDPQGKVTFAQLLVLAYQIHSRANGGTLPTASGEWYMPYYEYCMANARPIRMISAGDMVRPATRYDVVSILHNAIPAARLAAVKDSVTVPDVKEEIYPQVYTWYKAGIVSGGTQGNFNGDNTTSLTDYATSSDNSSGWQRRNGATYQMTSNLVHDMALTVTIPEGFDGAVLRLERATTEVNFDGMTDKSVEDKNAYFLDEHSADYYYFFFRLSDLADGILN